VVTSTGPDHQGPVLVTGASGFAGGHLLELLTGRHELVAWSRSTPAPELARLARWQQVDLLDRDAVRSAVRDVRPSVVYHLAGVSQVGESFADTVTPLAGNVLGTHHLFDALRRAGLACRILLTGSATVYASSDSPLTESSPLAPASPYGVTKLAQEQLGVRALDEDGLEVVITRSFNHTGPRQTPSFMAPAVARQVAWIERGLLEPIIRIGNTSPMRDLSDVRDVVRAYAALMRAGTPGTVYNVASGVGRAVGDVVNALISRSRVAVRTEVDPTRTRATDVPMLVGDATRLRAATGWEPQVSFERMIDDLLHYWRTVKVPAAQ
jgi:GDP-4-dehydro-6-deoxy-D-mannose reductase